MDENKKILLGLVVLGGTYMYMNPAKKERYYTINGQSYSETQLRSMGYREIQGKFWSPAMIAAAAGQGGVTVPGTTPGTNQGDDQTWAIISTLLSTGMQFIPLFLNGNNTDSGMGTGGGTGTGGGGGGTGMN
jgi:hypothetical protein